MQPPGKILPGPTLHFGPSHPPPVKRGDRTVCLYRRADVVITRWTDAPMPWPRCRAVGQRGGSGLPVDAELARAVRTESATAVEYDDEAPVETIREVEQRQRAVSGTLLPTLDDLIRQDDGGGCPGTGGGQTASGSDGASSLPRNLAAARNDLGPFLPNHSAAANVSSSGWPFGHGEQTMIRQKLVSLVQEYVRDHNHEPERLCISRADESALSQMGRDEAGGDWGEEIRVKGARAAVEKLVGLPVVWDAEESHCE